MGAGKTKGRCDSAGGRGKAIMGDTSAACRRGSMGEATEETGSDHKPTVRCGSDDSSEKVPFVSAGSGRRRDCKDRAADDQYTTTSLRQ